MIKRIKLQVLQVVINHIAALNHVTRRVATGMTDGSEQGLGEFLVMLSVSND